MVEYYDQLLAFINMNVHLAPFIVFGLLLLAGFNLPMSEDLMIFISAVLAAKNPDHLYPLFFGVFLGAYVSDIICYGIMGRYLGNKIFSIRAFASMVSREKIEKVAEFYKKYGIWTLIVGRFIPFGVRNTLFFTAGLSRMNFLQFAFSDLVATVISNVFFFWLYYTYGETVVAYVKKGNMIIFAVFVTSLLGLYVKKKMQKRHEQGLDDEPI